MPEKTDYAKTLCACCTTAGIKAGDTVIVACSGGSDSMALALIAAIWAKEYTIKIVAITVDHGLRSESAQEAQQVGRWLKKHGIRHQILRWEGKKPTSNRQQTAREARYRLLSEYASAHGITHVLLAHTQDDQAETFLLRLMRGSGVDGLAAMNEITHLQGIILVRPLLRFSRLALQDYLRQQKQLFVSDPSNEDARYDRIKMRKMRPVLAENGITDVRLAATARTMARAKEYLAQETRRMLSQHAHIYSEMYAELSASALTLHDEMLLRMVSSLLRFVAGQVMPLREEDLEQLLVTLKGRNFKGATLAGVAIALKKEKILFYREQRAVEGRVALKYNTPLMWDGRFTLTLKTKKTGLYVGALTQAGWLMMAKKYGLSCPYPEKKILYSLPALCAREEEILCVPHLNIERAKLEVTAFKAPF